MSYTIGIDLGGSCVKAVVVTPDGKTLSRHNLPFDAEAEMEWADRLRELVRSIQQERGGRTDSMGFSAPGLAAADGSCITHMPVRLEGLVGLNWKEFFNFDKPIPVLNDGHAALLGEAWLGAARGFQTVILLTLGTGVGGAALVEGKLLRGRTGKAGHFAHTSLGPDGPPDDCGCPSSLELAIGNCSLPERSGGRFTHTGEMMKAIENGDAEAEKIWLKSVKDLATAICSFSNILDPEAVILGGGISKAGDRLFGPLRGYLDPLLWKTDDYEIKLLPAQLGDLAGAYGAAANALGV
ncbi:MAG: ROK family protein [Verrucomicrobiota bacterium]|nr:ROK family protein [Verrucomicrobiota bacterium]